MKLNIKAALLSAFVLPGLGQLKNGRRAKGGILLLLSNVFLIGAVFVVLRGLGPVLVKAKITGVVDAGAVTEAMASGGAVAMGLLAFFAAVWCYAVVDALFDRGDDTDADG
ncbi:MULTISPECIES: hypothetical protein [Geobacter]|uniref:DUF5683 domain-containing protein n=2 Tax=Geobacter TaxID=28231 RepID=A0A0C1R0H8_9BACT|nr:MULTISPECIES: hypothetical protein [Geobacter]ANA39242.1 hypothetical protein A2G06_01245 [Geobacter anodireducens]KIE43971.1 hypothetical protein SE37_15760 [Geobacter soli]MBE2886575.1 hypothetical protein [Geobacter anodireducens]HMN02416.1 hypothetical protein [Geobacter anodireducens]